MIEIKLFRFDSKTDYLPYYKTYELERDSVKTIDDVLDILYKIEKFGYLKDEIFFLQANNIFTSSEVMLDEVLNDTNELVLEPISIKRSVNDFIIDTKDYKSKLNLLNNYLSSEEIASIITEKKYMLEYYASNTLHFNDDYIGEHVLFIASEIIQEKPILKDELSALVDTKDGIRIRSSLLYRILYSNDENTKQYQQATLNSIPVQSFKNFNIALYCALNTSNFKNIIQKSDASYIDLKSKHFDIPLGMTNVSMLMAGNILLEALDNNADFLIVNDKEELNLFDAKQKTIENIMGREINLPILTQAQFLQLLQGEKNISTLGFNAHKVKIPFLGV